MLSGTRKARDLGGGQAAEQLERQGQARVERQHRVAGGEHQAQQVVLDHVVAPGVEVVHEIRHCQGLLGLEVEADLFQFLAQAAVAPQQVEGAVVRGREQPGAGTVGDAVVRPALQRRHQGVLGQLLGQPDVAHDARDAADDAAGFDPPRRRDDVLDPGRHCPSLGGMLSI